MDTSDFTQQVSGVAALAEPVRRDLYLYVSRQDEPVSRDQACEGVGVARHTAKFHLDKLVEEGLLDTDFKRLSGRRGPGAGRPTKLYRRSARQLSVTLPERRYDLAGQLMARAIENSTGDGTPVVDALHAAAAELGTTLGTGARERAGRGPDLEQLVQAACAGLAHLGYEPHRQDASITLGNCPFDALAREHTALVCGMNLALLAAAAGQLGGSLSARLNPAPGRCCVMLDAAELA